MNVIKLNPSYKDYLWGGVRLKEDYNKKSDLDIVAESWELSAHPDGPSVISNGKYQGKTFLEYLDSEGHQVMGSNVKTEAFPILIKFIDAKQALSIQVHPDNDYALKVENEFGKNEAWYILDCEPGSFLYYGVNKELTKEEFKERIENNTVLEVLRKVEVKKGDYFYIQAGTIHAIGEGIVICEIQQSSNSTYRVYDFGRVGVDGKPRDLHIEKALDVSNLSPIDTSSLEIKEETIDGVEYKRMPNNPYFSVQEITLDGKLSLEATADSFIAFTVIEGQGSVKAEEQLEFIKGDSFFVPAGYGTFELSGNCKVIVSSIK